jgi:uncharacterized damage-inducible protein DinB
MPSDPSAEPQALLGALNRQREHVLEAVEGLGSNDLRRQVLPSAWSCIGLVNHLSLDVERFWFQAVIAGDQIAIDDVLASSDNAWNVSDGEPVEEVLHMYRANIEHADGIIASRSLDTAPAWWPDFFGSWRLHSLREIVLHVVTETATHAGHLDAARELIDGKLHLVLTH